MKKRYLLSIIFLFSGIVYSQAATCKAVSNGDCSSNTWNQSEFPGPDVHVVLVGRVLRNNDLID